MYRISAQLNLYSDNLASTKANFEPICGLPFMLKYLYLHTMLREM